jgi:hypothetical protein
MPVYTYTTLDDPLGLRGTNAYGIWSAKGQIVGSYSDSIGFQHGFLLSGGVYTTVDAPLATTSTAARTSPSTLPRPPAAPLPQA